MEGDCREGLQLLVPMGGGAGGLGAGHGSHKGHHGRLGTLLFACRERALGGVVVSVHGVGKGTSKGRSDGGLACLLEEEEEGGGKGEQQQGRASAGRFSAPCTGKKRAVCGGRGGRRLWRLGGRCKFSNLQGRELLFIEENLGLGFQMGQMGWVGLAQTLNRAAIIYFHFILWLLD
jgi:hypothetical protein